MQATQPAAYRRVPQHLPRSVSGSVRHTLLESVAQGRERYALTRNLVLPPLIASPDANPANAQRRSRNLTRLDRWLMFAVLQGNFLAWGYPLPRPFRHRLFWMLVSAMLLWVPSKMERITARIIVRHQALPALRGGRAGFAAGAPYFLLRERLRMMRMLAGETRARLIRSKALLRPL